MRVIVASLAVLFLACSQAQPKTEITHVPVVTEVVKEIPVVTEVPVLAVTEVPIITEVPVLLPPTQCPTQQDINNTLAWLEEARATHVIWADYLDTHELSDPLAKQGLGTAGFHRLWVARYTTMIWVIQATRVICYNPS